MYVLPNFKTKKALKRALATGRRVTVMFLGPFPLSLPADGETDVEGPHYPKTHTWYARVRVKDRRVLEVIT